MDEDDIVDLQDLSIIKDRGVTCAVQHLASPRHVQSRGCRLPRPLESSKRQKGGDEKLQERQTRRMVVRLRCPVS